MGYGKVNAKNAVTLAHDMFRQNETVVWALSASFQAMHKIYAGKNVTSIKPSGYYTVTPTGFVTFKAPESINLQPGFSAEAGSIFSASIHSPCSPVAVAWKQSSNSQTASLEDGKAIGHLTQKFNSSIYPNSVDKVLNIVVDLPTSASVSFEISNMLGQKVIQGESVEMSLGKQTHAISTAALASGIYLVTIRTSTETAQYKFTKQ